MTRLLDTEPCHKDFPAPISSETFQKDRDLCYTYRRQSKEDQWVIPYNARLLRLWKAHCNVQYCTSGGLARYISKYITKTEPKSIVNVNSIDHTTQHLLARRVGSMEMIVLLLGFPIFQMSSSSIYLPTSIPAQRSLTIKPS